ncbi:MULTISPECIES: cell division protein FtsQ/DivIB [Pseudoalteromonas]|uniref:Cell division protein FtsQ n=1 Tax=Pseudoalteromonas amylolytica TaxID=1859457 RepID=A0A1S1MZN3_9GAMM|nr:MULTISPECIES: cell division protein FtsQ/DivIB [Pseudoalteromonas]MCF6434928.1 cell division protein FtsQ/DivIB [Pseudoalteromonas sp. MMG022]OHU90723.1 cell division protein [Pseudoalteromonas sp. JW3]OHU92657.1 cell division protein [Pseudoalteromonas amylolytica]
MRAFFEKAKQMNQRLNWSLLLGIGFFILVIVSVVRGTYWVSDWLVEHKDAQIKQLTVLGEPHYTKEADIIAAIKQVDLSSYFELDVQSVHSKVKALPWIAHVSVRKQWPDQLQVYVVEHTPVAVWNSDLLLNQDGEVFQAQSDLVSEQLPQLYGPEGSEQEAWQTFLQFKDMLGVNDFKLVSLALSERFAWQLWLDSGIRLNLGREKIAKRVQRFIDVYPKMRAPEGAALDVVDLRYDIGLAVSWKYPQEQEQQSKSEA